MNINEMFETCFQFFRRLSSDEMSENVEDKLLLISDHLRKLHKYLMTIDLQNKTTGKVISDRFHDFFSL